MYNDKCPSPQRQNNVSSLANAEFGLPCAEMETINGSLLFKCEMVEKFYDRKNRFSEGYLFFEAFYVYL